MDDLLVCVQREWDGWQTAEVRLGKLQSIHWFQPHRAPRPLLHGYVSCASITTGQIPHNCERTGGPHRLLVCVLKRHNAPSVYAEIARRAAEQPSLASNGRLPYYGEDFGFSMREASGTIRRLRSR
ncbi:MAG: hypothetical protein LC804_21195 [Acidobacteria bacterium]|nr:hypothetical protein [Acidobacteriota bacterium]